MTESTTFCFAFCPTDLTRGIARITNNLVNLFAIPTKYYKFVNIFSKIKAGTLASYNLQIKLENREKPLVEREMPMDIGKAKENFNKDGKPKCFNCEIYRHMAKDCQKPKKEKNTQKCYECG